MNKILLIIITCINLSVNSSEIVNSKYLAPSSTLKRFDEEEIKLLNILFKNQNEVMITGKTNPDHFVINKKNFKISQPFRVTENQIWDDLLKKHKILKEYRRSTGLPENFNDCFNFEINALNSIETALNQLEKSNEYFKYYTIKLGTKWMNLFRNICSEMKLIDNNGNFPDIDDLIHLQSNENHLNNIVRSQIIKSLSDQVEFIGSKFGAQKQVINNIQLILNELVGNIYRYSKTGIIILRQISDNHQIPVGIELIGIDLGKGISFENLVKDEKEFWDSISGLRASPGIGLVTMMNLSDSIEISSKVDGNRIIIQFFFSEKGFKANSVNQIHISS